MIAAEQKMSNDALIFSYGSKEKTTEVYDLTQAIAAERPLKNFEEARLASSSLNNVLAFVEYGTMYQMEEPRNTKAVLDGLGEILQACRLVSLRVEQFIDLEEDRQEGQNGK